MCVCVCVCVCVCMCVSTCVSSTISAQTQKSLFRFSLFLYAAKIIISVFREALPCKQIIVLICKRNLLSDKTSHQALHSSIISNEAQIPSHHPLIWHLPSSVFPPLCLPMGQSTQWGVEEDGRVGGGQVMRSVS